MSLNMCRVLPIPPPLLTVIEGFLIPPSQVWMAFRTEIEHYLTELSLNMYKVLPISLLTTEGFPIPPGWV